MDEEVKLLIEEHEFYGKVHKKHLENLSKERKEREKQRKSKQRDILFAWKKEGEKSFQSLKAQTSLIHTLLKPHRVIKDCFGLLEQYASSVSSAQAKFIKRQSRRTLWNLHHQQKNRYYHLTVTQRQSQKISIQKEFMFSLNEKSLPAKRFYFEPIQAVKRFRILFRYFASKIHIDPKTLNELRKKRYTARMAERKMKMIKDTQKQCDAINYCKSLQHHNPKGTDFVLYSQSLFNLSITVFTPFLCKFTGCSNCGVIFIGGSLAGAVPYVKSLSRDTGVATLVTLAFELETLAEEEAIQIDLLSRVTKELQVFEQEVYSQLITSLQQFWRIVLLWKRYSSLAKRQRKSLYYYRIRRLVVMKREIDLLIKEPQPINRIQMEDKYWDIITELYEYINYQEHCKLERMRAFAKRFHRKLVVVVEEARERRYQEWLRLQNLPKPPRPILIKSLPSKRKEVYQCYRTECHLKTFLTYDRYLTHMLVHKQQDYLTSYAHHLSSKQKQEKQLLEQKLLQHLQMMKDHMTTSSSSSLAEMDLSTSFTEPLSPAHGIENTEEKISIRFPTSTAVSQPLVHQYNLYRILRTTMYVLTLVSKSAEVLLPSNEILLDQQVVRIGTHPSCECAVQITGELARMGMINKIHCLLYHALPEIQLPEEEQEEVGDEERNATTKKKLMKTKRKDDNDDKDHDGNEKVITIVDNSSLYGTYVVTKDGAMKVPTKISKGLKVQNGSLICVGVTIDGPPVLPVSEANSACLVFRLQTMTV